ncbi:hypothetical protein FOA52_007658 [Chlamydomonas sp. UWO 241]|nr:hypothetical protein FOA52_007658 [Chlamydomonas sp. UWO 241]
MGCGASGPEPTVVPCTPRQATGESVAPRESGTDSAAASVLAEAKTRLPGGCAASPASLPVRQPKAQATTRVDDHDPDDEGYELLAQARQAWEDGDLPTAESLARRACDAMREGSRDHGVSEASLTALAHLAAVLHACGNCAEAEAACRDALSGRDALLGADHADTLCSCAALACLLHGRGQLEEAEVHCRRALDGRQRTLGGEHPDTARVAANLSALLYARERYEEMEAVTRESLEIRERMLGPDHTDTLSAVSSLAASLHGQGRFLEAEALAARTAIGRARSLGSDHPQTLAAHAQVSYLRSQERSRAASVTGEAASDDAGSDDAGSDAEPEARA